MITVFSSTGCIRCKIVKSYLKDHDFPFTEHDVKTEEGKNAFREFYRTHRSSVRRDEQGIFFPVVEDGDAIVQDAGPSLGWFIGGAELSQIFLPNNLGHGWTGVNVIPYRTETEIHFVEICRLMKKGGLNIEAVTEGANPKLLDVLLEQKLIDRLTFKVIPGFENENFLQSITEVAKRLPGLNVNIIADIADFCDASGVMPQAPLVGKIAECVRSASTDGNIPFAICCSLSEAPNLFPYRTAARRWLPKTEIVNL
ncbi:MAG: hypothetical protein J6I40_08385 [Mailhella sp.]|nr:hypothetical protein [Mailhella sp.]